MCLKNFLTKRHNDPITFTAFFIFTITYAVEPWQFASEPWQLAKNITLGVGCALKKFPEEPTKKNQ